MLGSNDETARVSKLSLEQQPDCCDGGDYYNQKLDITLQNGGNGSFVTIATGRWAMDKDDVLHLAELVCDLIDKFDAAEANRS